MECHCPHSFGYDSGGGRPFVCLCWGGSRTLRTPPPLLRLGARHVGKAQVTEIPEGGFAPPEPPTITFQKTCPLGKFFEMIETAPPPPDPPHEKKRRLWRRRSSTQRLAEKFPHATDVRVIIVRGWTVGRLGGWKIRARARRYNVNVPNVR